MKDFVDIITRRKSSLDKEIFCKIEPKEGVMLFVDGGNAEIAAGPDFSLQFMRVAGIIFDGRKKTKTESCGFYALFYAERADEKLFVRTRIIPSKNADGRIMPDENELVFHFNGQPGSFADAARRVSEITLAYRMAESLSEGTSIILDGTLDARHDVEKKAMKKLQDIVAERKINLCGLSKTSSAVDRFAEPVTYLLKKDGPEGSWYCKIAEAEFNTYFAKLHCKSRTVFRCDAMPYAVPDVFSHICSISNDPVFPGYPYGLIEADRKARVSNREKEMLRIEFSARAGKKWQDIEEKETALNAHKILDSIG